MRINLFLLFTLMIGPAGFAQSSYTTETLAKIQEVENNIYGNVILNQAPPSTILERMNKYKVKGLSIAVIQDYRIAWAKGYGWADEAQKRPMTTETLFEPGSISKTLNALGILKLAQEKKVDLYTDINTYLRSWTFPYDSLSKGKKITLAHLLSHTGGLSTHGFPGHNIKGPIPTLLDVLDGKSPAVTPAVRSLFEPGLQFKYSGGGTSIAQLILSDVTGQAYDTWMYEQVLKPIGMVHSTYAQPPAKKQQRRCATAYYSDGLPVGGQFHVYPEQAAAGLWMSPSDLCHYIIDLQLAYQGKPSKVLSPEMVKLHLTPYLNPSAAMGTFIEDHNGAKYFQHGAANDGFRGHFYGSMEGGYGVAVFVNSDNGQIIYELINSVAKAYNWKNFYRQPEQKNTEKIIPVSEDIIQTYAGIYLYEGDWAAIGKRDQAYHFYANGAPVKLYFTSPVRFFNEEFSAVKEIIKDEQGRVKGYTRTVAGKTYPPAVKIEQIDTLKITPELFNQIGWYYFENKDYTNALAYFKRGAMVYPEDLNMLINVAHMHLFKKEFDQALQIHRAHLNDNIRPGYSWVDLMKDDYLYLKEHAHDVTSYIRLFAALNIKKPKG